MQEREFLKDLPLLLRIVFDLLVFFVSGTVFLLIFLFLYALYLHVDFFTLIKEYNRYDDINVFVWLQGLYSFSFFVLGTFFVGLFYSARPFEYLSLNRLPKGKVFLLAFFLLLALQPLVNALVYFSSEIIPRKYHFFEANSKIFEELTRKMTYVKDVKLFLRNVLVIALIPALGEELFFRGLIQRRLTDTFRNKHLGIFIAALLFSIVHFEYSGFLARLLLGLVLGYLFFLSRSLWLSVFVHFLNNFLAVFVAFWAARRGINVEELEQGGLDVLFVFVSFILFLWISREIFLLLKKDEEKENHRFF